MTSTSEALVSYAQLAQRHRPSDPVAIAAEVRRLHQTGLTARDIAVALRLPFDQVVTIVAQRDLVGCA